MAHKLLMTLFPRFSKCSKVDIVAAFKGAAGLQLKHQHAHFLAHRLEFISSALISF